MTQVRITQEIYGELVKLASVGDTATVVEDCGNYLIVKANDIKFPIEADEYVIQDTTENHLVYPDDIARASYAAFLNSAL